MWETELFFVTIENTKDIQGANMNKNQGDVWFVSCNRLSALVVTSWNKPNKSCLAFTCSLVTELPVYRLVYNWYEKFLFHAFRAHELELFQLEENSLRGSFN